MMNSDFQLSSGAERRRLEYGLADNGLAEREARLMQSRLWLAGGGVDSRGGVEAEPGAGATPAAVEPADARLWRAVRQALLYGGYRAVEVSVRDGLVILEGTVADIPTRVLAEDCCLDLPEVREVRNRLRVAPAAPLERELGA
jgi:hypothetical protein